MTELDELKRALSRYGFTDDVIPDALDFFEALSRRLDALEAKAIFADPNTKIEIKAVPASPPEPSEEDVRWLEIGLRNLGCGAGNAKMVLIDLIKIRGWTPPRKP